MVVNTPTIYTDLIESICDEIQTNNWMYGEYQEYILNNCGGDRVVLDDNLPDVAAEGYLLENFAETIIEKLNNNLIKLPPKLSKYKEFKMNIIEPEIVVSSGAQHRLTITPTRVTIKLLPDITEDTKQEILNFVSFARNQMGPVTQSWRGKISFLPKTGIPINIVTDLQTDSRKQCVQLFKRIEDGTKISR